MLFGYGVEQDFDPGKEQRRGRLWWPFLGGIALCLIYLFTGRPFATEVFQGWVATSLFYGENFYVQRRSDLGSPWLWKAILASLPLHFLYLVGLFWLDAVLPRIMTKAIVFIPFLVIVFGIESILIDGIIDRFKPRDTPLDSPVAHP